MKLPNFFSKIANVARSRSAFTLAEALIMLLFSGIVAMMAIPILNVSNEKNTLREFWKKDFIAIVRAYADIEKFSKNMTELQENNPNNQNKSEISNEEIMKDVIALVQAINGGELLSQNSTEQPQIGTNTVHQNDSSVENFDEINEFKKNISIAKFCGPSVYVCGVSPQVKIGIGEESVYKTLSNGYIDENDLSQNQFLLTNGANVYTRTDPNGVTDLWIDVNGYVKGPNKLGRDLFGVVIMGTKVIPMGTIVSSATNIKGSICGASDSYIPLGSSGKASDYAGATCSTTILVDELSSLLKYPSYSK